MACGGDYGLGPEREEEKGLLRDKGKEVELDWNGDND